MLDGRPFDSDTGRAAAVIRYSRHRRPLTLEDIEAELPRLTSIEAAHARLEKLTDWALAGLVAGTVLNGGVRGCEVYIKSVQEAQRLEVERGHGERMEALEERVGVIEDQGRHGGRR